VAALKAVDREGRVVAAFDAAPKLDDETSREAIEQVLR
jgi:hypothetical protein